MFTPFESGLKYVNAQGGCELVTAACLGCCLLNRVDDSRLKYFEKLHTWPWS